MLPEGLTIYTTSLNVVRKEIDDCRRLRHIFDTHNIKYKEVDLSNNKVISKNQITKKSLEAGLPQVFVGENFLGTFDTIEQWNENEDMLMSKLNEAGYKPQSEEESRRFDEEMQRQTEEIAAKEIQEQKDIRNPPPEPKFQFTSEASQKTYGDLPEKTREVLAKLSVVPQESDVDLLRFMTIKHHAKVLDKMESGTEHQEIYSNLIEDLKREKKLQFMREMGLVDDDVVDPNDTLKELHAKSEERDKKREESIQAAREAASHQHKAEVAALEANKLAEQQRQWEEMASKREERRQQEEAARQREEELRANAPMSDKDKFQAMLAEQQRETSEVEKKFKAYQEEFWKANCRPTEESGSPQ
eukprot:TRINITY_DN33599_c0_g1_i1.p1 TRINITY_DN33599_c0_g1~~TRINITY_DN33599_c0_g1_i1.p1  ORF type:complete len:359 (+),score=55.16 TRINITY_DN33599_c0_g1_i1:60-1136(+)